MLILPQTYSVGDMASTMDYKTLPKTIDFVLSEASENMSVDTPKNKSPIHEMAPVDHQNLSPHSHNLPPHSLQHQQPPPPPPPQSSQPSLQHPPQQHLHKRHQKEFRHHHPQQPRQPHHNWDINDSSLPVPDRYDPFDLWPVGHCRRVYRGDIDDARRHISGWAMRNTNNHNALILKKSCLGVLVCSSDCMMDNGRKVHFRPAICDKARRKQIGKPCPNPGCCGKLTLLPCRGHCGYPVTHFWRQVKGSVFFQAKGYHDHPRPDVKSLSEKGRNALAKHIRHSLGPLVLHSGKRRMGSFPEDHVPTKKRSLREKEVMCSCPPFECSCKQTQKSKHGPIPAPPNATAFNTVVQPGPFPLPQDSYPGGPVTQINITNTCIPPHTNLGVNIPYTPNSFLPPTTRIYHPNTGIPDEHVKPFIKFGDGDLPPHSSPGIATPHPTFHHNYEDFKARHPQIPYSDFQHRPQDPISLDHPPPFPVNPADHVSNAVIFERMQRTPNHYSNVRDVHEMHPSPGSEHDIKPEHFQPNFLIPYDAPPHYESRSPVDNRHQGEIPAHQNPAFLPDFNALNFCTSPTPQPRDSIEVVGENNIPDDTYVRSSHSRENSQQFLPNEHRTHEQNQEINAHQPTFITLTSPEKHSYEHNQITSNVSPQSTPCSIENMTCHSSPVNPSYNQHIRTSSTISTHPVHLSSPDSALMQLGSSNYEAFAPMSQNLTGGNSESSHVPETSISNVPCSSALTPPPAGQRDLSNLPPQHQHQQQHLVSSEGSAVLPHYHHPPSYTNASPPSTGFNPYRSDVFQSNPNQHPQQFQHSQQHGHQHQHPQRRNSINITLTYN